MVEIVHDARIGEKPLGFGGDRAFPVTAGYVRQPKGADAGIAGQPRRAARRQMAAFESQLGILVEKRRLDHQRIGAAHERYQRLCLFGVADDREPGCGRLAGLDLLRRDAPAIG